MLPVLPPGCLALPQQCWKKHVSLFHVFCALWPAAFLGNASVPFFYPLLFPYIFVYGCGRRTGLSGSCDKPGSEIRHS
ncbi:hypothetical protein NPIL_329261 [Nephila pilipes]|uniref:Uncharacterized protein n=1 Tax=Nephila pilipes TaxID=299642 RepID=A0A8X6QCK1_NEPPI|nr:hypothetical protein NPIL_329261 [Nephila pilipes]